MDSSVGMNFLPSFSLTNFFCHSVENETSLCEALRTYEESSRSLKSICNSVEKENQELEQQYKHLQIHQKKLIDQFHLIQQRMNFIRQDYQLLQQKQFIIDQQYSSFHQRFEQVQSALKQILSSAISTDQTKSSSSKYSSLGLEIIPIVQEENSTKRKQTSDLFYEKSPKKFSSSNIRN